MQLYFGISEHRIVIDWEGGRGREGGREGGGRLIYSDTLYCNVVSAVAFHATALTHKIQYIHTRIIFCICDV